MAAPNGDRNKRKSQPPQLALAPSKVMQALHNARLESAPRAEPSEHIEKGDPVVKAKVRLKSVDYSFTVAPGAKQGNRRIGDVSIYDPESEQTYRGTKASVQDQLRKENKALEERINRNKLLLRMVTRL